MSIWKITPTLDQLNEPAMETIHGALGILFTEVGDDFIEASMPVDKRTKNPIGILHGGASAVLAESLGSIGAVLVAGHLKKRAMGIELNASHLKSAPDGLVYGRATPIRIGKNLQVWEIKVRRAKNLDSDLVCISRLTVMVKDI